MCEKVGKNMSKVLFLVSPTLNSFVDKKKGTTGNKIDCALKHFSNAVVSDVQIAAVAGAAGLIGKANLNKAGLAQQFAQGGFVNKAKAIYKAVPKPVKAVALGLIGLSLLVRNYNKGKIEQKYLDRAQFVDNTFTLDGENKKATSKDFKA